MFLRKILTLNFLFLSCLHIYVLYKKKELLTVFIKGHVWILFLKYFYNTVICGNVNCKATYTRNLKPFQIYSNKIYLNFFGDENSSLNNNFKSLLLSLLMTILKLLGLCGDLTICEFCTYNIIRIFKDILCRKRSREQKEKFQIQPTKFSFVLIPCIHKHDL